MTNNKMKKDFERLGYELSYEHKSWNVRKHGTTEYIALGSKESANEYLLRLEEEAERLLENETDYCNDIIEKMD